MIYQFNSKINYIRKNFTVIQEYNFEDVAIIFTANGTSNSLHIVSKVKNSAYFNFLVKIIIGNDVYNCDDGYVELNNIKTIAFYEQGIYPKIYSLADFCIFCELNTNDFIPTNQGIIFVGIDKILPRTIFFGKELFLRGPLNSEIKQDLVNGLNNSSYLFINAMTSEHIPIENIVGIKELKEKIKEIKNYEID